MAVKNTWVLVLIHELNQSGYLQSVARLGFIDRGRGAISLYFASDSRYGASYLSRAAWEEAELDPLRRPAVFETIDTYQPLSQAVVVAISPVGNGKLETITCLIEITASTNLATQ